MMDFCFEPSVFTPGREIGKAHYSSSEDMEVALLLRGLHPELEHWNIQALNNAWLKYSQDVHDTTWFDEGLGKRDEAFLSFCYWTQTKGAWLETFDVEGLLILIPQWAGIQSPDSKP